MEIGDKLRNLRIQKNLTQEELGERTDLSKGYISQLERDLSSPSMETFFSILEVLGVTPEEFFHQDTVNQQVVYSKEDHTIYQDEENGYELEWLVSDSNEKKMEPVLLTFEKAGEYKTFEPSRSETFIFVLEGELELKLRREKIRSASRTINLLSGNKAPSVKESSNETDQSIDCCYTIVFVI